MTPELFTGAIDALEPEITTFLSDAIAYPSLRGGEQEYIDYLTDRFRTIGYTVEHVTIPDSITGDPDYAFPVAGLSYADRPNLLISIPGSGNGHSLIINTHTDVVPETPGWTDAFHPVLKDTRVYGRGACDTKGQVAAIFGLLSLLRREGVGLRAPLFIHLVIEEEVGGNGSLHMVRSQEPADGAIVMEPSMLDILPAVRGSVWYELTCTGRAGHSGRISETVNAIEKGMLALRLFREYHDTLRTQGKGDPLFDMYEDPMPLNVGEIRGGNWPPIPAQEVVITGMLGFLTNTNKYEVQKGLKACLAQSDDPWLRDHFDIRFTMLRNDSCAVPVDHPLVTGMQAAAEASQFSSAIRGMPSTCDAWMYNNLMKVPTIVFGPGDLGVAHTDHEQIDIVDIKKGIEILRRFIENWNGFE